MASSVIVLLSRVSYLVCVAVDGGEAAAATEQLLRQWVSDKWLHINDVTGYYELGARSHLELRPVVEAAVTHAATDQDQGEAEGEEEHGGSSSSSSSSSIGSALLQSLPQIIYY